MTSPRTIRLSQALALRVTAQSTPSWCPDGIGRPCRNRGRPCNRATAEYPDIVAARWDLISLPQHDGAAVLVAVAQRGMTATCRPSISYCKPIGRKVASSTWGSVAFLRFIVTL